MPTHAIAFGQRNGFFYWLLANGRMQSVVDGRRWARALGWVGDDVPLGDDGGEPMREPAEAEFVAAMGW